MINNIFPREWKKVELNGQFLSICHVTDFVKSIPENKFPFASSNKVNIDNWSGSESLEESYKRALDPTLQVEKIDVEIEPMYTENIGMTYSMDVGGDELDVQAYLAGEPECFLTPLIAPSAKFKTFLVNSCVSKCVSGRELEDYANKVYNLMEEYQAQGYHIRIFIYNFGTEHKVWLKMKDYGESINMVNIYQVMEPSFFRRIIFRFIEQNDGVKYCGYGFVRNVNELYTKEELEKEFGEYETIDI